MFGNGKTDNNRISITSCFILYVCILQHFQLLHGNLLKTHCCSKILDTYISRINIADDTRRTVVFTKDEYEEMMGMTCANYRALKKNTEGMLGKVVTLEMPNKEYLQFVLFEQARYHTDESGTPVVELTCTEPAKELFFCINKYHYFKYTLENVISLTRKSSYLLYIYIRRNCFQREWTIDLDELRDNVLDCKGQESYQEFKVFKRDVLNPASEEVNAKTDCQFEYEAIRHGRKVASVKFIYKGTLNNDDKLSLENRLFIDDTLSDEEVDEEELMEKKYGSESLSFFAGAMNYEFSKEETRVLYDIILKYHIEPKNDEISRYDFIQRIYHKLLERAADQSLPPLNSRYKYLKSMLKAELGEE